MKLFAYMINAETVFALLENGKLVERKEVESIHAAKEHVMSEGFRQTALHSSCGIEYELLWIDEPGFDDNVIFSAGLYEKRNKLGDELIDDAYERYCAAGKGSDLEVSRDVFESIVNELQLEHLDVEVLETEVEHVEDGKKGLEVENKSRILEPPKDVTIEVDHVPSDREKELVDMIVRKQNLKMELAGIQAEYNKDIKELDKQIFDYASGKAKRHVKAVYVYHWDQGVRDVVNTETGDVVRTEGIPIEFMQIEADLTTDKAVVSIDDPFVCAVDAVTEQAEDVADEIESVDTETYHGE